MCVAGCRSETDGATRSRSGPGEVPTPSAAGATQGAGPGQTRVEKKPTLLPRQAVKELIDRWLAAQNQGDFAAYSALYGDEFSGVRRSGKKTVRLDRGGWLSDRQRMFKRPMTVAVSNLEIAVGAKQEDLGLLVWQDGAFAKFRPLDFPEEVLDTCHCECE